MRRRARTEPPSANADDRLVLDLLQAADVPLTIAMLRARGVRAPAQTLYELMVVGHDIDRVRSVGPDGRAAIAYRLADSLPPAHGGPPDRADPEAPASRSSPAGAQR